MNRSKHNLRH